MQPGRSSASRLLRGAAVAVAVLLGAGCGSNFGAQTNQIYQPAAGVNYREGPVQAFNVLVVLDRGRATVIGALLNQAARGDALVGLSGKSANLSDLTTSIAGSQIPLPSQQLAQLGDGGAVSVSGGGMTLGSTVEITFSFQNAAPITVQVPVIARAGDYATVPVPNTS